MSRDVNEHGYMGEQRNSIYLHMQVWVLLRTLGKAHTLSRSAREQEDKLASFSTITVTVIPASIGGISMPALYGHGIHIILNH